MVGNVAALDNGERAAQVASAFAGIETGLRGGRARASQQIEIERNVERAGQRPGQLEGLVEAALAQARGVQGHANEALRKRQQRLPPGGLDKEFGQDAAGGQVPAELEAGFEQVERMAIAERRPGPAERRFAAQAFAALCRRMGQGQGTARAAGGVARQVGLAAGAEVASRCTDAAAKEAARWQQ